MRVHAVLRGDAFAIAGVPPGDYVVRASRPVSAEFPRGLLAVGFVSVAGADRSDVLLFLEPAATVSGRVMFDGRDTPPPPSTFRITLRPIPEGHDRGLLRSAGVMAETGTFAVRDVTPGRYRIEVGASMGASSPIGDWVAKSVLIDGREIADAYLEVRDRDVGGIAIALSDDLGRIAGRVVDSKGLPSTAHTIIAFPADPALWQPASRRIAAARPAHDGAYLLRGLPAGEYRLAAADDPAPDEWLQPEFLRGALPASVPVTVRDGSTATQDVAIAPRTTPTNRLPDQ
jgi:hypothetical protein